MGRKITHLFTDFSTPDTVTTEDQILGAIAYDCSLMRDAQAAAVLPEWFSVPESGNIFRTLRDMYNRGERWDIARACSLISRDFFSEHIAAHIGEFTPGTFHILALDLAKGHARRILYAKAYDYLKMATNMAAPLEDMLSLPGQLADEMAGAFAAVSATKSSSDVFEELDDELRENEALHLAGQNLRIDTGFPDRLDKFMGGGWGPGQLIILAARPSVGKTAVMLHMAKAAARQGKAVDIFSLEMTNAELCKRLAFSTGELVPAQLDESNLDWTSYGAAKSHLTSLPLYFHDDLTSIDAIISRITLDHQQGKCELAVIDHLGLMELHRRMGDNVSTAYEDATRRLKSLAKSLRIPVLLLSQLNRESAKERRSPDLFDLRNSGSIEQDADVILMLERVYSYDDRRLAGLDSKTLCTWIRKNRNHSGAGECVILKGDDESFTRFNEVLHGEVHTDPPRNSRSLMPTTAIDIDAPYNEVESRELLF